MSVSFDEKRFLARGGRHDGECYGCVISPDGQQAAWLEVTGTREVLVYCHLTADARTVVAGDTYVLSPCFAGDILIWSEPSGSGWQLFAFHPESGESGEVCHPIQTPGRPRGVTSCQENGRGWLTWEERRGKRTLLRCAEIANGHFGQIRDLTDGSFNAYDPHGAIGPDGNLHVIYSAFKGGTYRILLQRFDRNGERLGEPRRISNRPGPCIWPSACRRSAGGIWFSYTHLPPAGGENAYVQHWRRKGQHGFFDMNGRAVDVGIFADDEVGAPLAAPNLGQGPVAAMTVHGSAHGGHTKVLEDANGRLHLLLRQNRNRSDSACPSFTQEDKPLRTKATDGQGNARNCHPDICIMTLEDRQWSAPRCIIPRAHFEAPISVGGRNGQISLAFTEDARRTGWSGAGEWFDEEGQLGVGRATLRPESKPPEYAIHPVVLRPAAGPEISEPDVERSSGPYYHAIGQTHAHTNLSVCIRGGDGDAHLNYRMMQDVQRADFGGTTDHAYNMWHTEMLHTRKMAEYYYFPGEFVAFPAYEWTGTGGITHQGGPFGHVNPLWLEEDGDLPFYTPADADCPGNSLEKLWDSCGQNRVLTPPHHVADHMHPYNWNFFDAQFVPVVEIFQDLRGSGERPRAPGVTNWRHREDGGRVLEQLRAGRRFGFIGGGDHSGVALGGALVEELTRSGLYEALSHRRCFATTGLVMRLEFRCNGRIMGASVPCEKGQFSIRAAAGDEIRSLQVVRNGRDMETIPVHAPSVEHEWTAQRRESGEFWYCRLLFENGEVAWSSPIWLD